MNQVVTVAEHEATAAAESAYLDLLCGMCHRMEVQVRLGRFDLGRFNLGRVVFDGCSAPLRTYCKRLAFDRIMLYNPFVICARRYRRAMQKG